MVGSGSLSSESRTGVEGAWSQSTYPVPPVTCVVAICFAVEVVHVALSLGDLESGRGKSVGCSDHRCGWVGRSGANTTLKRGCGVNCALVGWPAGNCVPHPTFRFIRSGRAYLIRHVELQQRESTWANSDM